MDKNSPIFGEIKSLGQFRDELKVQAHLFKSEVKSEWERLEKDWKVLHRRLAPARESAKHSTAEIRSSTKELFNSLKSGYRKIKDSLPPQSS